MGPGKPSSVRLPSGETVPIVLVRLVDGTIVPRHPDELVKRPPPPAGSK